jgi:hypothetical protein|tara:strand:- start:1660 stop:2043 length:384 start_codon:yes stop_codon:yes gene_type:complete
MRIILIILLAFILTSCTFGERKIKFFQVEEPRPELNLESPEPLTLEDLKWIIITSKNAEEVFARLEAQGFDPVLFGLTDKDYELIAKNFAEIRSYLKQQNAILEKYKEYYEPKDKEEPKDEEETKTE